MDEIQKKAAEYNAVLLIGWLLSRKLGSLDQAVVWMSVPNENLNGKTPYQVIFEHAGDDSLEWSALLYVVDGLGSPS